tara:strand:- start:181 stop:537 length:357 start_codon:yes stop_codon:yes gene_type:complete
MKVTKSQLKQIIKEEIKETLDEGFFSKLGDRLMGFDKFPEDPPLVLYKYEDPDRRRGPGIPITGRGEWKHGPLVVRMAPSNADDQGTVEVEFDGEPGKVGDKFHDGKYFYEVDYDFGY